MSSTRTWLENSFRSLHEEFRELSTVVNGNANMCSCSFLTWEWSRFSPALETKCLIFASHTDLICSTRDGFRLFFFVECWIVAFFARVDELNTFSTIPFPVPTVVYVIDLLSRLQFFLSRWALTQAYLFDTRLQCEDIVKDHLSRKTHMARIWWLKLPLG